MPSNFCRLPLPSPQSETRLRRDHSCDPPVRAITQYTTGDGHRQRCPRQSIKGGAGRLALGIVSVSKDFLERAPQSLLIYWRENCTHSRTPKLLVKILILNNKDVMAQSLFALVTTDRASADACLGSKADLAAPKLGFRFTPESGFK